jgi:hypothetical protein
MNLSYYYMFISMEFTLWSYFHKFIIWKTQEIELNLYGLDLYGLAFRRTVRSTGIRLVITIILGWREYDFLDSTLGSLVDAWS